ncbi:Oxysterol-binding protein [Ceraceosorus bombacis]|uniref:Oxysterol-binding protein n=1 Tax=Ceraceosorus bombacis TaxID=401625 RepID=A0A0P1BEW1_9BASI|nr:Oxysterol-binding protein [Ceraceosorus bombacis]
MPQPRRTDSNAHGRKAVKELDVLHEGWVLKKKRKKMQGYAKRYLILTKQGTLTYALTPEKLTRDAIEIPHASVTSSQRQGTLHVDSGSSVFHIKMLNPQDFNAWRAHLRSFIPEREPGSAQRIYVASDNGSDLQTVDLSPLFTANENVAKLIAEVQKKVGTLKEKGQPLLSSLLPVFEGQDGKTVAELDSLVESLAAEHLNLQHALETKIPKVGGPDGTMDTLKSRVASSRMSISSFHTTHTGGDATFFDADAAAGAEFGLDEDGEKQESADNSRIEESSGAEDDDDDESGEDEGDKKAANTKGKATANASTNGSVQYRKKLPAPVSGDEVSLFSMLKKNVGKDLSTVSFPVSFNCPLSLLQAAAEEYEYAPALLERASKTQDWVERICLVGAFAVSGYAASKLRASRKPWNPLLGETFECVREDQHLRFVAEKVVHQPPVVATYAEGKGWRCHGWSAVKNKFWGKSLELIPEGSLRLELDDGDAFSFSKPSSFMRNLLAGNKYLEHVGELTVTNENTGQRLVLEFKEGNMWGSNSSRNLVHGEVFDEKGKSVSSLRGKWSDNLAIQKDKENYQLLWEAAEMPPDAEKYYGFTYFALSLNEITKDVKPYLPPTDSRFRPDQRAFEEGKVDEAEELKQKVEQAQRERRKAGKSYEPRWFHKEDDDPEWKYGSKDGKTYFKSRAKAAGDSSADKEEGKPAGDGKNVWSDCPNLFEP